MTTTPAVSLAERKRRLVADELAQAALELFTRKGFDAVTVDEIAAGVGVSKRTFFRYFASKEEVIVRVLAELGADMRAELAARPAEEPPSVALRHAIGVSVTSCTDHPDQARRVVRLIVGTPALYARFLERQAQWREDLAAELAIRTGSTDGLHPRLAAGTALAAFDVILQQWSSTEQDPAELTARAFAALAPALDATAAP